MFKDLVLDERELAEIGHCLDYRSHWHHGTVGHNLLMLVGKTYEAMGFWINENKLMYGDQSVGKELVIKSENT